QAIGLEPPVEHPFGLVLLGRDEADGVFAEPFGREFGLDARGPAVFVIGDLRRRVARRLIPQRGFLGHDATSKREARWGCPTSASRVSDTCASAPRSVSLISGQCGRTMQADSSVQSCR